MGKRTKLKALRAGFVIRMWVEVDVPRSHCGSLEEALEWAKSVEPGDLLSEDVCVNDGSVRVQQVYDDIGELDA